MSRFSRSPLFYNSEIIISKVNCLAKTPSWKLTMLKVRREKSSFKSENSTNNILRSQNVRVVLLVEASFQSVKFIQDFVQSALGSNSILLQNLKCKMVKSFLNKRLKIKSELILLKSQKYDFNGKRTKDFCYQGHLRNKQDLID